MKIFDSNIDYSEKVNFVDKNNVFVGYDMQGNCCEIFGYYILEKVDINIITDQKITLDLEDYLFCKYYFTETKGNHYDVENLVIFKLEADNKPDLYLHLFNCHNGYYSHGFQFKIGDRIVREGEL